MAAEIRNAVPCQKRRSLDEFMRVKRKAQNCGAASRDSFFDSLKKVTARIGSDMFSRRTGVFTTGEWT